MPLLVKDQLEGFLFFDSTRPGLFSAGIAERLAVYGRLVALMISHESTAVRSLVGSVRIAREFAHLRDVETGVHLDRMSRYCRVIARALSASGRISDEFAEQVFLFSPLHDIGKIGVPDAILRKRGLLTFEEREEMKLHVTFGNEVIDRLVRDFGLDTLSGIDVLRNLVAGHHEYLDGSGYPNGWRAEQIPIEARIVTVADIFDALSSRRVYKAGWSLPDTLTRLDVMVVQGKIDSDCVQGLKGRVDEVRDIMERFVEEPLGGA
jgi:HD-GYP domain-containing protein (c-di-GMP phosphodiesterase class II)